jgi:hypothetical protein
VLRRHVRVLVDVVRELDAHEVRVRLLIQL